jgi:hypothetical protein
MILYLTLWERYCLHSYNKKVFPQQVGLSENIGALKTRLIGLLTSLLRSDACRIRSFHSPQNFALLRRMALNALNREQTYKRCLRQKMKRAAMDNNYMIQVLSCCFIDNTLNSSDSLCQD